MKPIKSYTNLYDLKPVLTPKTLKEKLLSAYYDTHDLGVYKTMVMLDHDDVDMLLQALELCPSVVLIYAKNAFSSIISIPKSRALVSFEPASSPAKT